VEPPNVMNEAPIRLTRVGQLQRRPSLVDTVPDDVLFLCVSVLSQKPRRPEWVASLCACSHQLWQLLPSDLRSAYLEASLQVRPGPAALLTRGVLKGEPGSSLLVIERRQVLRKALVTSAVNNRLKVRPEPASLLERGVLKAEPGTSALVTTRKADLQKALVTSAVSNRLKLRPEPASLLERGVLKAEPGVSLWLIQARDRLQKEMIKQAISRSLASQARVRADTC